MKILNNLNLFATLWCALLLSIPLSINAAVEYDNELEVSDYAVGFKLVWSTLSETDNQYFVIERSTNGRDFVDIGSLVSEGDEFSGAEYRFDDLELGLEKVSYRLRQIDYDGTYSHTIPTTVSKQEVAHFRVLDSSWTEGEVYQFAVESIKQGDLVYQLTNINGEVVQERTLALEIGVNNLIVDLEYENPGTYEVVLKLGEEECFSSVQRGQDRDYENVASKNSDIKG